MIIANKLEDIDITLDPKALTEKNYQDYYVVTKPGRGRDTTAKIIRIFNNSKNKNLKILFSGFKGCGKSTELIRLKKKLENDYLIKIFSVREELDPNNFTISELLITIMSDLFNFINNDYKEIKLSNNLIKNIENWIDTIIKEDSSFRNTGVTVEAGINTETGLGKILNILAKLKLDFKAGRQFKSITNKEIRQDLPDLILNCNLLLGEITHQLNKISKKNIIFIIEDLEKIELDITEELFLKFSTQLTSLSCCLIYTFPISLVFHPKYKVIIDEFDECVVLPMIKVHNKNQSDYYDGINVLKNIIYKRINNSLISEPILEKFIKSSGGCLRDLFRMIKAAASNALDDQRTVIEAADYEDSFKQLKTDYYNTISYNPKNEMNAQDYYKILVDCYKNPDKKPDDVKGLIDLKHNMSILGYNGDGWFDVHPAVVSLLRDKGLLLPNE